MPDTAPLHYVSSQEVHIWQWKLDVDSATVESYWETLSVEEQDRATKYRFEMHRRRFVVAHGHMRLVLAKYLGGTPEQIVLGYGSAGKPHAVTQPRNWHLNFNLSHSGNIAALAVSNGIEIGIDIEHARPIEDDVMLRIFSPKERTQFDAFPPLHRTDVFFENWTRKEACLKALGTGLEIEPTHFEFDLERRGNASLLCVGPDAAEAGHWKVQSFQALEKCQGAVAARSTSWSVVQMPQSVFRKAESPAGEPTR